MTTRPTPREQALADRLAPWRERALDLVARRLADARALAEIGRMDAAEARLDELRAGLAGGRGTGLVPDARAAFYRQAHGRAILAFDPAIHRELAPDPGGEAVARTGRIGALSADVPAEARAHAAAAARELAAVAAAPGDSRGPALDAWEARHRAAIAGWAAGALSEGQVALTQAVARLHVEPGLR